MDEVVPRTIRHTELPAAPPGEVLSLEWNTYRREVGRLLAEGHAGKFVLIKGSQIIAFYDAWDAAREAGLRLYLMEPFLVHEVRAEEPLRRVRGYTIPWPIRLIR
jgi:hypothetical protein